MKCDSCNREITIGEWPYCPHGKAQPSKGFEPYWDENISDKPVWVSTPGDRKKYLKPHWDKDYVVHVQERR